MPTLTAEEVATVCHKAGFSAEALVTIVAIAKAESGFNPAAVGDQGLVDATFGPSIGLLQIRSLHAERGTGGVRDELANFDPVHNATSGFEISGRGVNFRPWSTFNTGAHQPHVAAVRGACRAVDPHVGESAPAGDGSANALLREGDGGPDVAQLQRQLTRAGFPCAVDGDFGPRTRDAVIAFQRARGLAADGVAGPATRTALAAGDGAGRPVLEEGDEGPLVVELQERLGRAGFAVAADGQFGPKTRQTVVAFQRAQQLDADGVVGPRTWAALLRAA